MNDQPNISRWFVRGILLGLAVVQLLFWQPFYGHFYAYLTGTILTHIITRQWHVALLSILFFLFFLVPLSYRKRARWADYGLVGAFFVSLFVEMYGVPLTILFASKYFFTPGVTLPPNVVEFELFGVGMGMDHAMVYGAVLMALGMLLIILGWHSLYRQSKRPGFARDGLYAFSRHPQYVGFILLIVGWFVGWPTILTVVFSPVLIWKYIAAARSEERYLVAQFGRAYDEYRRLTPFLV